MEAGNFTNSSHLADTERKSREILSSLDTINALASKNVEEINSDNNNNAPRNSDDIMKEVTDKSSVKPKIDIGSMINKMVSNPEEVAQLVKESASHMNPQTLEKAKKAAMGSQGALIMKEMQRKGINVADVRANMKNQMSAALKQSKGETRKVVHITSSRKLKTKDISISGAKSAIGLITKCNDPISAPCSRLAKGELEGREVQIWYDPQCQAKNKKASLLAGFMIGGDVVISSDCDVTESMIEEVEMLLR